MNIVSVANLKLRSRMLLLVGAVLAGFLFATFIGLHTVQAVRIGSPLYLNIKNNRDLIERMAFLGGQFNQVRADIINLIFETDPEKISRMREDILRSCGEIDRRFENLAAAFPASSRAAVDDVHGTWKEFAATLETEMIPAVQRMERFEAWQTANGVQRERYETFRSRTGDIVAALKAENERLEKDSERMVRNKIASTMALEAALFSLILLTIIWISRSVTRPMLQGVAFAQSVASGDLTRTLQADATDEIGDLARALNAMVGSLNHTVGKVNRSADELATASGNIFAAASRVNGGAHDQASAVAETSSAIMEINGSIQGVALSVENLSFSAAESSSAILQMAASVEEVALNVQSLALSVEEVSSSILEMTASIRSIEESAAALHETSAANASSVAQMDVSIREVERNALETASIAGEVYRDAEAGKASVEAAIAGMREIRRSSAITSEAVSTLSRRVGDIGVILSVIDEVADQTSLLALNAAIIAAQAGEHGRGFAVVADEIRELADRTSTSTREITQVIKGVQEETRRAVQAIGAAEQSIVDGESLSQSSGQALEKILAGARKATDHTDGIARATVEQARGSESIRGAIEQVADMVEQISRATREQAKGTELIIAAVERMKNLTHQVKVSTGEQSKTGGHIARSTETISDMVEQIRGACEEQTRSSVQIVVAVEGIQASTAVNVEAAEVMNRAAESLKKEIAVLHEEMKSFHIAGDDPASAPTAPPTA